MQISSSSGLRVILLILTVIYGFGVARANPQTPKITITNEDGANFQGKRVVARYGIISDSALQSKLAVKELSFLLKKYPDAKTWAVAYNIDEGQWRVIEYNRTRRQLIERKLAYLHWGYDFYPAHIHKAAQKSLDIDALFWLKKRKK